jgi:flavin reductase (DIM6/NTAB) family NADH-FMN oxidoreductase RutF
MPPEFLSLPVSEMNSADIYSLLSATVVPRPIAFVSTCDEHGVANLAPFSFFMIGGASPASLMYSPTLNSDGAPKDSLRNVLATREFVVNTVHREMADGMNETSIDYPAGTSEWELSGFTQVKSLVVRPPRVLESLVQFECRLFEVVEHGSKPGSARYVIGEVVMAHLNPAVAEDLRQCRPIARLSGREYIDLADIRVFELIRPKK